MKVSRWGNSLALRLPAKLVEQMGLKEGDELDVQTLSGLGFQVRREVSKTELIERLSKIQWELPKDYKFDRDEANAR